MLKPQRSIADETEIGDWILLCCDDDSMLALRIESCENGMLRYKT